LTPPSPPQTVVVGDDNIVKPATLSKHEQNTVIMLQDIPDTAPIESIAAIFAGAQDGGSDPQVHWPQVVSIRPDTNNTW
jgi:hypothetical protein